MIAELASWLRDARITDRPWKLREVEVQMQSLETHFAAVGVAALRRSLTDAKVSTQPDRFDDRHSTWRHNAFQILEFVEEQDARMKEARGSVNANPKSRDQTLFLKTFPTAPG